METELVNRQQRRILTVETEPSVRSALCTLLASIENDLPQSTRDTVASYCRLAPERLLVDLRCPETEPGPVSHGVKNLAARFMDRVLVLTIEASSSLAFLRIHELVAQDFGLGNPTSRLRSFVHALF